MKNMFHIDGHCDYSFVDQARIYSGKDYLNSHFCSVNLALQCALSLHVTIDLQKSNRFKKGQITRLKNILDSYSFLFHTSYYVIMVEFVHQINSMFYLCTRYL